MRKIKRAVMTMLSLRTAGYGGVGNRWYLYSQL